MKRIAIIGADGMLGSAFVENFTRTNVTHYALTISDIDITNLNSFGVLAEIAPDVIINCAAYTAVDLAENEPELAVAVNSEGVKNLAIFATDYNCKLVHFSTDYVFSGKKELYTELDETGPIGVYGNSKLQGEQSIQNTLSESQYLIIRTAWLYGPNGNNFVNTMLNIAKSKDEINVVGDQFGAPTFTIDLVNWTLDLLKLNATGVYHGVNSGSCSWCEFAKKIFDLKDIKIKTHCVDTKSYPTLATRPKFSVLENKKLQSTLKYNIRNWAEALSEYLISITI